MKLHNTFLLVALLAVQAARANILATSSIVHPAGAVPTDITGDWHFNEGSGQVAGDASGHSNDGQLGSTLSADTSDPTWIAGAFGAALRFDGNDFVEVAAAAALESPTITAEAWVRSPGPPGLYRYVLSKGASGCVAASYAIYTGGSGGLFFYIFNGSSFVLSPDAGRGIWDGNWHHVAGTFDGSTVRLYVDGVEIGSGTPATISIGYGLPTHDRFYIGAYRGTCEIMFLGDIDEVRVWSRALLPLEVSLRAQGRELVVTVAIDIKPGGFPNSINPRSKGVIPVAILTTDTFDAATVDPTTVFFGPSGTEAAAVHFALEDVDGDGDTDMILHFDTQETDIQCGDISVFLTGETFDRQVIQGSESVKTAGCK